MAENQTTKERLICFIKSLGIGQGKFEKECGLSNGWVNNIKATIKDDKLQKISLRYPELNTVWLLTGEGAMCRTDATGDSFEDAVQNAIYEAAKQAEQKVKAMEAQIEMLKQQLEAVKKESGDKSETINSLAKTIEALMSANSKMCG